MRKQIFLILAAFLGLNSYSQISFEEGYYIDNSNNTVDCLIENIDWENNPTEFEYKQSESSEKQTLTIKSVKEFAILSKTKYVRQTVNIDRSSNVIGKIDNNINPLFTEEQLFLKVVVEGKANLYVYYDEGLFRYFFSKNSSDVEQLVCKSYLTSTNQIAKNNLFRQQLMENLKCQDISFKDFQYLEYKRKDLTNIFVKYNECQKSEFINFEKKQKRDLFNLTLMTGLKYSSLYVQNDFVYFKNVDFGNNIGFRFGLEAEFIMPFNNNKWAAIIEPSFQYFNSTVTKTSIVTIGEQITATVDYKSIELSMGLRHYFFLSDKSKLFINGSLVYDFSLASSIQIIRDDGVQLHNLDILSRLTNNHFGIGYKYNERYNVEIRYQSNRDVLGKYQSWMGDYSTVSIVFGLSFF